MSVYSSPASSVGAAGQPEKSALRPPKQLLVLGRVHGTVGMQKGGVFKGSVTCKGRDEGPIKHLG